MINDRFIPREKVATQRELVIWSIMVLILLTLICLFTAALFITAKTITALVGIGISLLMLFLVGYIVGNTLEKHHDYVNTMRIVAYNLARDNISFSEDKL